MKIISRQDYEILRSIVFSNQDINVRLRANVIVLYEKGIEIERIHNIVEKSLDEIYNLLQYVDFFGIGSYLEVPYEELAKRVNDEIFKKEKEKIQLKRKGFFYYIFWPISTVLHTVLNFKNIIIAFVTWIIVAILRLFSNQKFNSENRNIATFEKGASNNYLIQINKLIINQEEEKSTEKFIASNQLQLEKKIEEIIESNEEISFNNPTVDYLIGKGRKKDQDGKFDKSNIQFYASLIVAYLIFSSSFKGGAWTIGLLGMTIIVSVRTYSPSFDDPVDSSSSFRIDSIRTPGLEKDQFVSQQIDSIRSKIEANQPVAIYDYRTYFKLVEEFYEIDGECDALSAVGDKQKKFIYEYDKIDHRSKDYFIDSNDEKYYVHVVAYKDLRQAAFQMHYLNSSKLFKAKILRVITSDSILYAVVIGEFYGYQVKEICDMVDKWDTFCFNDEVEIGCYFNG